MEETTVIPYCLGSNLVIPPKFLCETDGKYIFSVFSPINGRDIKGTVKNVSIDIEIIVPFGVVTHLKQVHYEQNGSYMRDERMDRGLVQLEEGKRYNLKFLLPKQMDKKSLVRGDMIGALIFNKKAELVRFWAKVHLKNLLRYKRLSENAFKPSQSMGSAGIDLPSVLEYNLPPNEKIIVQTNLAFQIPKGFYGQILGRSGMADKFSVGVLGGLIDNTYRGEIFVILYNHGNQNFIIKPGDRIAQLVIAPYTECALIECELDNTIRGKKGLGSTGYGQMEPINVWNKEGNAAGSNELSFEDLVRAHSHSDYSLSSDLSIPERYNYPDYNMFDN